MNLLFFTRPVDRVFFHELAERWRGRHVCRFMSDHRGREEFSMPDDFYRHLREAASGNAPHVDVDDVQYRSIIARCRFLRTVKAEQAHRWIDAMWLTCERIIDEVQPDMIVGSLIDSYVQDICDRVARQRGIRYAGYLTTMVAGYSRLTTRGELWEHRTVESDETARVLEMMGQRNYVPQYAALNPKAGRFSRHAKAFVTKYLKQQLKYGYYALAKVAARDPHNLYYNVHLGRGGMICRKPSYLTVDKYTQQDWRDQLEAARQRGATIVYLPLQVYPESTIDYWGTNPEFADFDATVLRLVQGGDSSHVVVLKDHPCMLGYRDPQLFRQIRQSPHAILAPTEAPSNEILQYADLVATWNGSVGFEAAIRGIPLITLGQAYFDTEDTFLQVRRAEELDDLADLCQRATAKQGTRLPEYQAERLVQNLLGGFMPVAVTHWCMTDEQTERAAENLDQLAGTMSDQLESLRHGPAQLRAGTA